MVSELAEISSGGAGKPTEGNCKTCSAPHLLFVNAHGNSTARPTCAFSSNRLFLFLKIANLRGNA